VRACVGVECVGVGGVERARVSSVYEFDNGAYECGNGLGRVSFVKRALVLQGFF